MTAETGPSQSMVEKVRDAICAASADFMSAPLHMLAYEDMARAAIATIPEPTPAMIEAGASVLCEMVLDFASEKYWAEKVFKAMISAALSEGK